MYEEHVAGKSHREMVEIARENRHGPHFRNADKGASNNALSLGRSEGAIALRGRGQRHSSIGSRGRELAGQRGRGSGRGISLSYNVSVNQRYEDITGFMAREKSRGRGGIGFGNQVGVRFGHNREHQEFPNEVNTSMSRWNTGNTSQQGACFQRSSETNGTSRNKAQISGENNIRTSSGNGKLIHCDVCNKTLNSEFMYNEHVSGKKHKEMVEMSKGNPGMGTMAIKAKESRGQRDTSISRNVIALSYTEKLEYEDINGFMGRGRGGMTGRGGRRRPIEDRLNHIGEQKGFPREVSMGRENMVNTRQQRGFLQRDAEAKGISRNNAQVSGENNIRAPTGNGKLIHCDVCNKTLNSEFMYNEHVSGKKHKEMLETSKGYPGVGTMPIKEKKEPRSLKNNNISRDIHGFLGRGNRGGRGGRGLGREVADRGDLFREQQGFPKEIDISMSGGHISKTRQQRGLFHTDSRENNISRNDFQHSDGRTPTGNGKLIHCDVCNKTLNSEFMYNEHVSGKKHKEMLETSKGFSGSGTSMTKASNQQYPRNDHRVAMVASGDQEINNGNGRMNGVGSSANDISMTYNSNDFSTFHNSNGSRENSISRNNSQVSGERNVRVPTGNGKLIHCDVCNKTLNSEFMYNEHVSGKKHKEMLELSSSGESGYFPSKIGRGGRGDSHAHRGVKTHRNLKSCYSGNDIYGNSLRVVDSSPYNEMALQSSSMLIDSGYRGFNDLNEGIIGKMDHYFYSYVSEYLNKIITYFPVITKDFFLYQSVYLYF